MCIRDRDITTAQLEKSTNFTMFNSNPRGITFNNDGTRLFVIAQTSREIVQYNLSAPYDFNTAEYFDALSVSEQETVPEGITFNDVGTKLFLIGSTGDDINEYTLSTAYDISTAEHNVNVQFSVKTEDLIPMAIRFSNNGLEMYILGRSTDKIYQYTLNAPYDITTASLVEEFSIKSQEVNPTAFTFTSDGSKLYVIGFSGDDINEYDIINNFEISSAMFIQNYSIRSESNFPTGLAFGEGGQKMFITDFTNDRIVSYNMPAYDIASKSFNSFLPIQTNGRDPRAIIFNSAGTKMYSLSLIHI